MRSRHPSNLGRGECRTAGYQHSNQLQRGRRKSCQDPGGQFKIHSFTSLRKLLFSFLLCQINWWTAVSSQKLEKTLLDPVRIRWAADPWPSHPRCPPRALSCHSPTSASPFIPSCSSPLLLITRLKQEKGVAGPIFGLGKGRAEVRLCLDPRVSPR